MAKEKCFLFSPIHQSLSGSSRRSSSRWWSSWTRISMVQTIIWWSGDERQPLRRPTGFKSRGQVKIENINSTSFQLKNLNFVSFMNEFLTFVSNSLNSFLLFRWQECSLYYSVAAGLPASPVQTRSSSSSPAWCSHPDSTCHHLGTLAVHQDP